MRYNLYTDFIFSLWYRLLWLQCGCNVVISRIMAYNFIFSLWYCSHNTSSATRFGIAPIPTTNTYFQTYLGREHKTHTQASLWVDIIYSKLRLLIMVQRTDGTVFGLC